MWKTEEFLQEIGLKWMPVKHKQEIVDAVFHRHPKDLLEGVHKPTSYNARRTKIKILNEVFQYNGYLVIMDKERFYTKTNLKPVDTIPETILRNIRIFYEERGSDQNSTHRYYVNEMAITRFVRNQSQKCQQYAKRICKRYFLEKMFEPKKALQTLQAAAIEHTIEYAEQLKQIESKKLFEEELFELLMEDFALRFNIKEQVK